MTTLQAQGLLFAYPQRTVVSDWNAEFSRGLTWLRGRNGSGKTTVLKLLGGALAPLAGRITLGPLSAALEPLAYRRQVFWCGPGAPVLQHLTPSETFAFLRGLYPSFDDAALARHLEGFALTPMLGQRVGELSTGTQRKVWLAAGLAAGTAVLLLDEPMPALDQASLSWLHSALAEAAGSRIVVMSSHEDPGLPVQATLDMA